MVGEINVATYWGSALSDVNVIVHLAARVHVMRDTAIDPLTAFCAFNVVGTLNIARQAAAAEVKRFVYISSVKVYGASSCGASAFVASAGMDLTGRGFVAGRGLCVAAFVGNMQVDISKARSLLGWVPPVSVKEGLRRAMAV